MRLPVTRKQAAIGALTAGVIGLGALAWVMWSELNGTFVILTQEQTEACLLGSGCIIVPRAYIPLLCQ